MAVAQAAGTFEVAVFRDDDRGVAKDRFHDEGRHLAGAMLEEGLQGPRSFQGSTTRSARACGDWPAVWAAAAKPPGAGKAVVPEKVLSNHPW